MRRSRDCSRSCCSTTPGARPGPAPTAGLVPLAEQDRSRWDTRLIAEGVDVLQAAPHPRPPGRVPGPRPPSPRCTPTPGRPRRPTGCRSSSGTTNWYASPAALWPALNRAVAVGEADGPRGLAWPPWRSWTPPCLLPHRRRGSACTSVTVTQFAAARLYAEAAPRSAPNLPERDHLTRQAVRLNAQLHR